MTWEIKDEKLIKSVEIWYWTLSKLKKISKTSVSKFFKINRNMVEITKILNRKIYNSESKMAYNYLKFCPHVLKLVQRIQILKNHRNWPKFWPNKKNFYNFHSKNGSKSVRKIKIKKKHSYFWPQNILHLFWGKNWPSIFAGKNYQRRNIEAKFYHKSCVSQEI